MKTSEQDTEESCQFLFKPDHASKNLTRKPTANPSHAQFSTKPLISKLEINFPTIKICQSRREITQDSFQRINKSASSQNSFFPLGINPFAVKQPIQGPIYSYRSKNQTESSQSKNLEPKSKVQQYPARNGEYSYQETTKEDNDQNNMSSYHDFFKVPFQINNAEIPSYQPVNLALKDPLIQNQKQSNKKSINIVIHQTEEEGQKMFINAEKTHENSQIYSYPDYQTNSKKSVQAPIKQKGNLTLSQLLTDLQKKSEKLYEIYGQNNEDYQKCLETIQKNQKSLAEKPSNFQQQQKKSEIPSLKLYEFALPEPNYAYGDSKSNCYDSWKTLGNKTFCDFSKKSFESRKDDLTKRDEAQFLEAIPKSIDSAKPAEWSRQSLFEDKKYEPLTYTPTKQKPTQFYEKLYESADKKTMESPQKFHSSTKGIITSSKSLTKKSNSLEKKKKVMFYSEQEAKKSKEIQKGTQFVNKIARFFNKLLLNYIKANYFYETGVLSTESNIHASSGRNTEQPIGEKAKNSSVDTSFFEEYFEKKDKNLAEVIVCSMMGMGAKQNGGSSKFSSSKKLKQQDILAPYALLPIQEQLQTSYGFSMVKKPQTSVVKDSQVSKAEESKGSKRNDEETESKYKDHVNSNESKKCEELLIYSVDKNLIQNHLTNKKESQVSKHKKSIDLQRFTIGFDKIAEIMKYKFLTQVRYGYLTLKFINPQFSGKGEIQSLKISEVGKYSKEAKEIVVDTPKSQNLEIKQGQTLKSLKKSNILPPKIIPAEASLNHALKVNCNVQKDCHQPVNILERYYKKSSPNSQTNEYSSIIEERSASPRNKNNEPREILQQDYYQIGVNVQNSSKISENKVSRALSSTSSKAPIAQGPMSGQEKIMKESLLSMKQSQLPIFSPTNSGSKFGQSFLPQESVHSNGIPFIHASKIVQNPQNMNQNMNTNAIRLLQALQPEQKKLDYHSKGKIARSFSETDFKHYQNHLNTIRPIETIRPQDNLQKHPSSVKNSLIHNLQMKASNMISSVDLPTATFIAPNQSIKFPPNLHYLPHFESQAIIQIGNPPNMMNLNSRTIRPMVNPSMQKRRSQSVSSGLYSSNFVNGSNPGSNTPSMLKNLEGKPFIQFNHQNHPNLQTFPVVYSKNYETYQGNQGQNYETQNYGRVPFKNLTVQNRPRMTKSMDQFLVRTSSTSGYNLGNYGYATNQYQSNPIAHHVQPQYARPGSDYIPPHQQFIQTPYKPMKKQVEVDSEYHMMKKSNFNSNLNSQSTAANGISTKRTSDVKVSYEQQTLGGKAGHTYQGISINSLKKANPNQKFQSPSTHSPLSPSIRSSALTNDYLGTLNIPKPKSPGIVPKARSPEIPRTKPLLLRPKQGRLSNYGQM